MIQIIISDPDGLRWVHLFPEQTGEITVGRGSDNDVIVEDPRASRRQLTLRQGGRGWFVEDTSGRGTTKLNGFPLDGPTGFSTEDELSLGSSSLRIVGTMPLPEGERSTGETWTGEAVASSREQIHVTSRSPKFSDAFQLAKTVAATNETVLISGETGTGKEVFARIIHEASARREGPFVVVNCPGIPESLFESELFGVEKRVATGVDPRPGKLAHADGGTVLLDEIGDLPLQAQAKILRFLQEGSIDRVGGTEPVSLDVRVLAATNVDLEAAIEAGTFRSDLYHRIAAFTISLPPLRERRQDIPTLVEHFLTRTEGSKVRMDPDALAILSRYDFPGNVRELELVVRRAALLCRRTIGPGDLPDRIRDAATSTSPAVAKPEADVDTANLYERVVVHGDDFWETVRAPFLRRELSRQPIQALVSRALEESGGSYAKVAKLFRVESEYRKLVDFLRHNQLRPGDG